MGAVTVSPYAEERLPIETVAIADACVIVDNNNINKKASFTAITVLRR